MAIAVTCSTCGKTTNCPDELAGLSVPCSGCGTNLTVAAAGGAGALGGPMAGYGGYGGYGGGAQQSAPAKKSGGNPWFFQWWVLALGGIAAIALVAGVVFVIAPKPQAPAAQQPETPAEPEKPAEEKKAEDGEESKPAAPKGLAIAPLEPITLEAGQTKKVKVTVERGGTMGAIPLRLENLPDQVTAEPVEIPEGEDSAELTIAVAPEAMPGTEPTKIKLLAEAGEAQAELDIEVAIKPPPAPVISTIAALTIRPGAKSTIDVKVDRKGFERPITLVFEGLPDKVTATKAPVAGADPAEAAPAPADPENPEEGEASATPSNGVTLAEGESAVKVILAAAADAPEATSTPRITSMVREQRLETPFKLTIERFSYRVRPLPVITLKPGESKTVEVIVDRRSYKGPLKLEPQNLPEKVTANSLEIAENQTKAQLTVAAAEDAPEQIKSAALAGNANNANVKEALVVRVSKGEGSFLPAEVTVDSEFARLLKKGSIGGRMTTDSKAALMAVYGGTAESEAAVMKGLAWLAKHQHEDGHWSFETYGGGAAAGGEAAPGGGEAQGGGEAKGGEAKGGEAGQAQVDNSVCNCKLEVEKEVKDYGIAATAFGILPFLGAGVTHDDSPSEPAVLKEYRPRMFRAIGWLAQQQKADRQDPKKDGELPGGMYAHAIGTIALCEAYGLSKDDRLKVPAQRALKYLVQSQHQEGGWRYAPRQPGDVSVVGWVFLAIRSGQLADLPIEREALVRAGKFMNTCGAGPDDAKLSRYSYLPGEPAKLTTTAAGLLTRQYTGWDRDNPDLLAGTKYLMENLPPEYAGSLGSIYYYYYATQVLHHMEGENWDKWNHRMREHLIRTQEKSGHAEGSWSPAGTDFGTKAGRIYATSMALMTLEAYYRHLPMYKRAVKVAGKE